MKKSILTKTAAACILCLAMALQSCWVRLGDLTVLSNRNYDRSEKYVELQRGVRAKGKRKGHAQGALEVAVDKAVSQVPGGEYLSNVTVETNLTGKKVRVTGDVWGKK